jgi:hypothetical protein
MNIIHKYNMGVHTKIPYHRNAAYRLHKANIDHIINYCFIHQIPIPNNLNILSVAENIIFSKSLLHRNHPIQIFLSFLKENNLTIIPADKTPHLCIIQQKIYETMVNLHLSDSSTYTEISTNRQNAIYKVLKNAMANIPKITSKTFSIPSNFSNRTFKILAKLQKPSNEWISYPYVPKSRPIVNDTNSITQAACKALLPYLQTIEKKLTYTCTSSLQIILKIQEFNNYNSHPNFVLATGDLENMYTNIDTNILINILNTSSYNLPQKKLFLDLLWHILRYTTFTIKNKIYLQKRGLPMGSCLSGTLANIFLDAFEKNIIPKYSTKNETFIYARYIDDIFIVSKDKETTQTIFNNLSNNTNLKINFETSNKQVSFLDLQISKNSQNFLIVTAHYKFGSPIHRPFSKNIRLESNILIGQFLRIWRLNNCPFTFSNQILNILRYLNNQGISRITTNKILRFLSPIRIYPNRFTIPTYNTNHLLCDQCLTICSLHAIEIKKIITINGNILASKTPISCGSTINCIIGKIKLLNNWFVMPINMIHAGLQLHHYTISQILPIGNLSPRQFENLLIKFPDIKINKTNTPNPTEELFPIHVFPIVQNPSKLYGISTAFRREKALKNKILYP